MGPKALAQVLRPLAGMFRPEDHPELLLGLDAPDDAAVYRLDDERALVLTSDFFPPVVDDPYDFGAIAAANALSDVYAMGAEPMMAINLVGHPDHLDPSVLSEILRGGGEKVREAGAVVAGGHTTSDKEPKYGLAVTGIVHPDRILTKGGARIGDRLFLTKPLGTGVVTTALKRDAVRPEHLEAAVAGMSRLNRGAAAILGRFPGSVHAVTDITGFALAGHAHEMARASGVRLRLRWEAVPLLPGAAAYAATGQVPGGGRRNEEYYGSWIHEARPLEPQERILLYDPQTSGGLFFAVDADRAYEVERAFRRDDEPVWRLGEVVAGDAGTLELR